MSDEIVAEATEAEVVEVDESVDTDAEWLAKRNNEIAAKDDDDDTEEVESEVKGEAEEKPEPSESSTEKDDDGFQARIDELTQRYYTEKQQREHFQKQWEDSRQPETPEPGKTLADFEYDEGKFSQYIQEQAVAGARAEIERGNQQQATVQRRAEFEVKEQGFASNVNDYHTVTRNQALQISQTMVETLQTAEKGPEVLYYLGKNPDVAAGLAAMSPLDAARELGKIEATNLVKPEPSVKKTPTPVPKIKAAESGGTRVSPDTAKSDEISDAEWLKRRNKQIASR